MTLARFLFSMLTVIPLMSSAGEAASAPSLHVAAEKNDVAGIRKLLAEGVQIDVRDGSGATALLAAAHVNRIEAAQVLIDAGIDVDHVNRLGWTALLEAIILGKGGEQHQKIVSLLVKGGANVNLADGKGVTPLQHARRGNYKAIEAILLAANAR